MSFWVKHVIVILALMAPIVVRAQSSGPVQLDAFGKLNSETTMVRLQIAVIRLAERLEKYPDSMLQFVIYRGRNQSIGEPYRTYATYKATYVAEHYDTSRIISTICESRPEPSTQIWLIDSLAQKHSCTTEETRLSTPTLFVTAYAPNDKLALGGCCMIDDVGHEASMKVVKLFADFVIARPGTTAYIVLYGGTNVYGLGDSHGRMRDVRNLDSPSFVSKLGKDILERLISSGLDRSRIVMISGGYRDTSASIDLWVVSPGGRRPKPSPNYFKRRGAPSDF
jgi:hypothetical protein